MRSVLQWLAVAALLWWAHAALQFETEVEVYSSGVAVEFTVAGTTLRAPISLEGIRRVSLELSDGFVPPGGDEMAIWIGGRRVILDPLPGRFKFPDSGVHPLGDWEIDDRAPSAVVYETAVRAAEAEETAEFTLRTSLAGRFQTYATLTVEASRTIAFQFRRGLINNDLFVRDADGRVLAVTSIDPRPLRDLGATAATIFGAGAAGAFLMACALIVAGGLKRTPLAGAVRLPDDTRLWWLIVFVALCGCGRSLWIAGDILAELPHQPDSVVYTEQARWLLDGGITADIPPAGENSRLPLTYFHNGRWVSHYPPGWPLVLAAGVALGAPWIVAPLLCGIWTLLLFALGRRLFGGWVAAMSVLLATLSPMAGLMFACRLSHALNATLLLAAGLSLLKACEGRSLTWGCGAGLFFAWSFATRPLTALAVAVPCGVVVLVGSIRRGSWRSLVGVFTGGGLGLIPLMITNARSTGSLLAFPYTLASASMYGLERMAFGIRNMDVLVAQTVTMLHGWGWGWQWRAPMLLLPLAFAAIALMSRQRRFSDVLLMVVFATVMIAHVGTQAHGIHGFGPRYYFDVYCCLFLLTARGFQALASIGGRLSWEGVVLPGALFVCMTVTTLVRLPQRFELYRGYNQVSGALLDQMAGDESAQSVILFVSEDWRNWAEVSPLMTRPDRRPVCADIGIDSTWVLDRFPRSRYLLWDGLCLYEVGAAELIADYDL